MSQYEVGVFIDFENIQASVKNSQLKDRHVDWRLIIQAIEPLGRLVIRRAYANWSENAQYQTALTRCAVEVRNAVGTGKNVSDLHMVIDVMETLMTQAQIGLYVIVSGDSDFVTLVQRLRGHGKQVIGLGVKGTVAQSLVEVCDDYIYYDDLLKEKTTTAPPPKPSPKPSPKTPAESASADNRRNKRRRKADYLGRLRQQVKESLPPGKWINASTLIYRLRRNRNFDREMSQAGFERFRDMLEALSDVVEIRTAPGKGHMEVRGCQPEPAPANQAQNQSQALAPPPNPTEDYYIKVLGRQRLYMTPSRYRPDVILRAYDIMQSGRVASLSELREETRKAFENHPDVNAQLVKEIIYQLFRAYSFDFDKQSDRELWDCPFRLQPKIETRMDLMRNCDLYILRLVESGIPDEIDIDPALAARVLYGRDDHPAFVQRASSLIAELQNEGDDDDDDS